MELFRNEFKCVECDGVGYANSVEAILKRGKLCKKCFLKSKGLEEDMIEVKVKYNPNFSKAKHNAVKEFENHKSLKREPAKKRKKKEKETKRW